MKTAGIKNCFECRYANTPANKMPCKKCTAGGNLKKPAFQHIIKKADTREGPPVIVGGETDANKRNYR